MKKVFLIFFLSSLIFLFISCTGLTTSATTAIATTRWITEEDATYDCIPGYSWSNSEERCKLNLDAYIFGDDIYTTYKIQYEGDDYTVYRTYVFIPDDTNIIVDMGNYNGYHYYFSSDTHYNYYLVEKGDDYKRLNEAIESGWFSLEDMVTLFNISQLLSEEIN